MKICYWDCLNCYNMYELKLTVSSRKLTETSSTTFDLQRDFSLGKSNLVCFTRLIKKKYYRYITRLNYYNNKKTGFF